MKVINWLTIKNTWRCNQAQVVIVANNPLRSSDAYMRQ